MDDLSRREKQVLVELLKNARVTDQEIARKINTSRPTVAKIRQRLEKNGIIRGYGVYTNFERLNINVNAVILYRWVDYKQKRELEENNRFIRSLPEVVMFIKGEGMGSKTDVIISVHENLKEFELFIRRLKEHWGRNVEDVDVFLSSIDGISKRYDVSGPVITQLQRDMRSEPGRVQST